MGLAIYYGIRARSKRLELFAKFRIDELLTHRWSIKRSYLKLLLLVAAVLFIVITLARPRWGFQWIDVPNGGVDIMVVLDLSTSMHATDIKPSRLERAKREIRDLIDLMEGDRLGVVAFAGVPFVQCPLTADYRLASLFVNQLNTEMIPIQGTALGDAIFLASKTLLKASTSDSQGRAIIVISDGEDQKNNTMEAAEFAAKNSIKIYGIGIGALEGAPIPLPEGGFKKDRQGRVVLSKLDEETLKNASARTSGMYVRSTSGDMDLDYIYKQGIRKELQDGEWGESRQKIWYERYQWFLLLALILLALEFFVKEFQDKQGRRSILSKFFVLFFAIAPFIPNHAEAKNLKQALKAFDEKDYSKASKHFLDAEIEDQKDLKHAYNRAVSQYLDKDFQGAASGFAKAAKAEDKNLSQNAQFNLGNALAAQQKFKEAMGAYESLLKENPEHKKAAENLQMVKKIIEQQKQQKNQKNDQDDQKKEQEKKEDKKNQEQSNDQQNQSQKEEKDEQQQAKSDQDKQEEQKPDEAASEDKKEDDAENSEQENKDDKNSEQSNENQASSQGEQKEQGETGQQQEAKQQEMSVEDAERILRSLESSSDAYGKPKTFDRKSVNPPEKDW